MVSDICVQCLNYCFIKLDSVGTFNTQTTVTMSSLLDLGSHGGDYEDYSLLDCNAM
jgi:hypothetical protein